MFWTKKNDDIELILQKKLEILEFKKEKNIPKAKKKAHLIGKLQHFIG